MCPHLIISSSFQQCSLHVDVPELSLPGVPVVRGHAATEIGFCHLGLPPWALITLLNSFKLSHRRSELEEPSEQPIWDFETLL